jgi:ubiquinone/menaquinone biosynthesis C-methylase UbiE
MATNFLRNPPIKEFSKITGLSRETVEKRFPQINVSFEVGDIRKLPFPENMFDIAITRQSIEQNPESYYQIFGEINRIIRERAIFFEEFEEFQNIFQKLYLKRKNMFHASSKELERYGFVVESLIPSPLKKVKYGIGLVNAKKSHDLPLLHL